MNKLYNDMETLCNHLLNTAKFTTKKYINYAINISQGNKKATISNMENEIYSESITISNFRRMNNINISDSEDDKISCIESDDDKISCISSD